VAVVAGSGNNGGDGYEIARLALDAGCEVRVCEVDERLPKGDGATARAAWLQQGSIQRFESADAGFFHADLVVDAIFGTGLTRAPQGAALAAIEAMAQARKAGAMVLAVDVPSGLHADTGAVPGSAVQADLTVQLHRPQAGLHTGQGPACCGRIVFDALEVPEAVYWDLVPLAQLLDAGDLRRWLPPRPRTAHKGDNGHVLIVGGDAGTIGAVLLAAACRTARRCRPGQRGDPRCARAPADGGAAGADVPRRGNGRRAANPDRRADVVAIGPGLGQADWARMACAECSPRASPWWSTLTR